MITRADGQVIFIATSHHDNVLNAPSAVVGRN